MHSHQPDKPLVRRKRKGWKVLLILLGLIAISAAGVLILDAPSRQEVSALNIGQIDFSKLADGTYHGKFIGSKGHLRDVTVQATLKNGTLAKVTVLSGAVDSKGNPLLLNGIQSIDDLFDHVIVSQTLQVDAISGATLTSKAHLKALENALEQAQTK